MKKLLLGAVLLSTLTIWWCSTTLNEVQANDVGCEALENNFNILTNQLWKLQTENDEQKIKIQELEKVYENNKILSWEIKELNKRITDLEEQNKKLKDEITELREENKELSTKNNEIETDYSWSKSKIAKYIWIIKELKNELSELKDEAQNIQNTWNHWTATLLPTNYSKNKIETNYIHTSWCEYTTKELSEDNSYQYMPNNNWSEDIKFVNNVLKDIQDNWEKLISKYLNEANIALDTKWLTTRDQCKYSLLIDLINNQKGIIKSYKNENWKITIWINFISYKENITRNDRRPELYEDKRDLENSPSYDTKYYTLSDDVELETLNVDKEWFLHFSWNTSTIFINDRDSRINKFCNDEPIYIESLWWELTLEDILWQYHNQNDWHYCIKERLDSKGAEFGFTFDEKWNISRIKVKYNIKNQ
jgi:uncharacterized protein YoxC